MPVPAGQAALAALQDGADALLVDLAGPARLVVEGDHLRALAAGWRLARVGDDLALAGPRRPDRLDPPAIRTAGNAGPSIQR